MNDLWPAPRAIVFDMDGVLLDTERLYVRAEGTLLSRRGLELTRELSAKMMGLPGVAAMDVLRREVGLTESAEALFEECERIFRSLLLAELAPMSGAIELLARIEKKEIAKAIATSTRRDLTFDMLGQLQLTNRFQFILTRDDVREGKPDPEIYSLALTRLGLTGSEVVVLEDSKNGVSSAVAAGCRCIAIRHADNASIDLSAAHQLANGLFDPKLADWLGV